MLRTTYLIGVWTGPNADRWEELARVVEECGDWGRSAAWAYAQGWTEGTEHAETWSVYTEAELAHAIGSNVAAIREGGSK